MKTSLVISTALFCLSYVFGQEKPAASTERPASKWEAAISAFEAQDETSPATPGQTLFIGSSSIRMWNLEESFPDHQTLNRGFGGSELSDAIEFAPRIVYPYKPSTIFLYAGDNDIANGKTASAVFDDFVTFSDLVRKHLPDTRLIFISIKPSLKRWTQWPEMQRANDMILGYARSIANREFADIARVTLGDDLQPVKDLFIGDLLHLSKSGYAAWAEAIAPLLDDTEGARRIEFLNYPGCIELTNKVATRAVLGHHVGGRVLVYSQDDKNALYLDPNEAKWGTPGGPKRPSSAGRFDIGPEYLIPSRPVLWSGEWQSEITGPRSARLTSQEDPSTGVQLIREFELAEDSSHLSCRQIIRNTSDKTKQWCHWSRTLAIHGGIPIVPLTPATSKFPNGYIMMETRDQMNIAPEDPNIRRKGRYLEITAPPEYPKLGMDSHAGWFAYQMPNDFAFVKRFIADPARVYNEIAGLTISVWYPKKGRTPACELEPIGPREDIAPGDSASFTEHWWLVPNKFPAEGCGLDLDALGAKIESETTPADQ
jgi:lysophospholipase L1-like esterase